MRRLYIVLLRLHPAAFRERFGDEMLDIAGNAAGLRAKAALIADAVLSLARQWMLRSEFRRPAPAPSDGPAAAPLFRTIEPYKPATGALMNGGLLAIASLCAVVLAIGHGGRPSWFVIGAHRPGRGVIQVDRDSLAETTPGTTVSVPDPEDPWRRIAGPYFSIMPVLAVLDADRNFVISPSERLTAPAALRRLDSGRDGKLDAGECGFSLGARYSALPGFVIRARGIFMRENPVLAALDGNQDGEIAADEIAASSTALKTLDRNRDGSLTPDEVMPDQTAMQAAMIVMRFDANDDGGISTAERAPADTDALRDLIESADRNRDGAVTRQELNAELSLRRERNRQLGEALRRR